MCRGTVSEDKANQQDPGGTLGILLLVGLAREVAEAQKNSLPYEKLAEVWVINRPKRNWSFWSAMQITVKWQECSVCLSAEHEGDSVPHASQHRGPDSISSHHPTWLGARAAGCTCLCYQKPGSLLAVGLCLAFPELVSALVLVSAWLAACVPQQIDLCISLSGPGTWTAQEKCEDVPYPGSASGASVPIPSITPRDALKSVCVSGHVQGSWVNRTDFCAVCSCLRHADFIGEIMQKLAQR